MSIQLSKPVTCPITTDGVASSFSVSVSDVCLYSGLPDFSPIDAVSPTVALSGFPATGPLSLNSKGTIITGNFTTVPPASNFQMIFTMFRNI